MKVTLLIAMLSIGFVAAAPAPSPGGGPKGPPGPPSGSVGQYSNYCGNSNSLSSLHCCDQSGSGHISGGSSSCKGKKGEKGDKDERGEKDGCSHNVSYGNEQYTMDCSPVNYQSDQGIAISSVCAVTVACCVGDGCTAIA